MFNKSTTLIVVYKDEMFVNYFKKLVETKSENKDISVVSWSEKVWLAQKKAGNINSKILFLGNIKGTEKLLPVVDLMFDEFGIKYGWAGNQALICVDEKMLKAREMYLKFADELNKMPIPDSYKISLEESKNVEEAAETGLEADEIASEEIQDNKDNKLKELLKVKDVFVEKIDLLGNIANKTKNDIANKSQEILKDKNQLKSQMMFFGIVRFYNNDLDSFINF